MLMELQGKKAAAHDFLLIYNKDSRHPPLSRVRPLTTHDFLGSLERVEPAACEAAIGGGAERPAAAAEHVLPGGIGTYSITHVSVLPPSKHELGTCPDRSKPEPHSNGHFAQALPPWGPDPVANGTGSTGRWPPPIAGRSNNSLTPPPPSSMHQPAPDKRRFTMADSIPVKSFPDVSEEDEEEYLKVEMNAIVDGKGKDQKQPNTPRSKHSATEQRRRSKINDRFQILRDLIPHSDQKRDKASFLLEVIEYIRFLQEKVQKYEDYPGWNQENAKVVQWNQLPVESITDHPEFMKAGLSPPGYMFSGKFDDNSGSIPPVILANSQNLIESELCASVPYNGIEAPVFSSKEAAIPASMQTNLYASVVGKVVPHADKMAYQSQSQWLRSPYPGECTVSSATLNEQEDPSIDEGALSVSRAYSQELLTTLSQSLQSSGIDASISVQINLGKRVIGGHTTTATMSTTPKDQNDLLLGGRTVGPSRVGSSSRDDSEPAPKRHKSNK